MLAKLFPFAFGSSKQTKVVPVVSVGEESGSMGNIKYNKKDVVSAAAATRKSGISADFDENTPFGTFRIRQKNLVEAYNKQNLRARAEQYLTQDTATDSSAVLADCTDFVHGLNLQPQRGRPQSLLSDMCTMVAYEHDGFENPSDNKLGNFLLRCLLKKTAFYHQGNVIAEEINFLLLSFDAAVTLIDYQRNIGENNMDQALWLPLHGCLALTDICLMAAYQYIESCSQFPEDSFENIALSIDSLFLKFHSLGPKLECESDNAIKLLFCQSSARSCLVIQSLIFAAVNCSRTNNNYPTKLILRLIQLLQSLAPNMALCRQVCGEKAGDISILFWAQCDSVADRVLSLSPMTGAIQRATSEKKSIRAGGEYLAVPAVAANGSLAMKVSSINRIRHALLLTIPTPQELFMEICRLKNANPRNSTVSYAIDGIDDDAEVSTHIISTDQEYCGVIFLKLKHALAGFQFLLRMASIDSKEMKLSMPNVEDWISSLAESIFVVLNTYAEGRQSQMSQTGFEFLVALAPLLVELFFHVYVGADVSAHYDWIYWEMTKRISSFVEMSRFNTKKIKLSKSRKNEFQNGTGSPRSHEGEYTDRSSNNTAMIQSGRGVLVNADSSLSNSSTKVSDYHGGVGNATWIRTPKGPGSTKRGSRSAASTGDVADKRSAGSPLHSSASSLQRIKFSIGQTIEGLVKMSTGAEKWFHGKISVINLDGTYDVDYDDGDFQKCKVIDEIRPSSSKPPPVSEANSNKRLSRDETAASNMIQRVESSQSTASQDSSTPLVVGDAVIGLVKMSNGSERWSKGVLIGYNSFNGTYDLQFSDGSVHKQKPVAEIRTKRGHVKSPVGVGLSPIAQDNSGAPSPIPNASSTSSKQRAKQESPLKVPSVATLNLATLPTPQSPTFSEKPKFAVGEKVDGLVKLTNGSERWFPGTIAAVNVDSTYEINYDDGDIQKNKSFIEIRQTKTLSRMPQSHALDLHGIHQQKTAANPAFAVGDAVDGLVIMQNGSERWFPGKLCEIHANSSCDIAYDDGTAETGKLMSQIRVSKKKKAPLHVVYSHPPNLPSIQSQKVSEFSVEELHSKLENVISSLTNSPTHQTPTKATDNSGAPYAVDDLVFGLVVLANGNSRWFPGKISAVHGTQSVDITYNDGDFEKEKPLSAVKPKQATGAQTLHNPPDSLAHSGASSNNASVNISGVHSSRLVDAVAAIGDPVEMKMASFDHEEEKWISGKIVYINLDGTLDIETDDGNTEKFKSLHDLRRSDGKKLTINSPYHSSRISSRSARSQLSSPRSLTSLVVTAEAPIQPMETIGSRSESNATNGAENSISMEVSLALLKSGKSGEFDIPVDNSNDDDNDDFDDDDDSADGFYAIPSIFAGGIIRKENLGVIPGIAIGQVKLGGSGNFPAPNGSLSASLLHPDDKEDIDAGVDNSRKVVSMSRSDSGALNNYNELSEAPHRGLSVGGFSRMLSWREMKDPNLLMTKRNSSDSETGMLGLADLQHNALEFQSTSLELPLDDLIAKDEDEAVVPEIMKSYYIMIIVMLRRCIIDKYFIDHACCTARIISTATHMHFSNLNSTTAKGFSSSRSRGGSERPNSARSESAVSMASNYGPPPLKHINLLFNLREFLEMIPAMSDNFFYLAEIANVMGPNYSRVLKCLHQHYFQSCLPSHIDTAEKVGEGGFGTIFKITCPYSCGAVAAKRRFLNPLLWVTREDITPQSDGTTKIEQLPGWRNCNCKCSVHCRPILDRMACMTCGSVRSSGKCTNLDCKENVPLPEPKGIQYAVKRIPRCRSVHDAQIASAVFNEITSLAALEGVVGVCQLVDYGVHQSEYWLVMEMCGLNLSEWRRRSMDTAIVNIASPPRKNPSPNAKEIFSKEQLSVEDACTCLTVFVDILFIIKSVHAADVGHFDVKCNNFVMKLDDPNQVKTKDRGYSLDTARSGGSQKSGGVMSCIRSLREAHEQGKPSGQIVLIDFGEAMPYMSAPKSRSSIASTSAKCRGTLCIQSPEIISISSTGNNGKSNNAQIKFPLPSKSSDVWSLGCLLVELLSGHYLFGDRQWADLYVTLCRKKFDSNTIPLTLLKSALAGLPDDVQESVEQLLLSIMKQIPSERPPIDEIIRNTNKILSHYIFSPFLRDYSKVSSRYGDTFATELSDYACMAMEFDNLRREVLSSIMPLSVQLGDSNVVVSDAVILRIEATAPHPILLSTQYAVEVDNDRGLDSTILDKKPSLLVARAENVADSRLGTDKSAQASLMSQFEVVDKLIATSDLSRVVKDVGSRLIRSWSMQGNLLQIMVLTTKPSKIAVYRNVSKYGLQESVQTVLVTPDEIDDLLPAISRAYNRGCRALSYHQKVIITVNPIDDPDLSNPDVLPTYSKLAVSIATAMADGLSIWSSAGSGRKKLEKSLLLNAIPTDQLNTTHNVGNYAHDIESACCRRVIDIVLDYCDREADHSLSYAKKSV